MEKAIKYTENDISDTDIVSYVNNYKLIYRKESDNKDALKDIEVYKRSIVEIDTYIFVQTIRLMSNEVIFMINKENLTVFAENWYNRYIA